MIQEQELGIQHFHVKPFFNILLTVLKKRERKVPLPFAAYHRQIPIILAKNVSKKCDNSS